ncbi:SRPBCC family protein [Streptomyces sp. 8N616]|uniref:SRPBCC family protein n=1 Tax=Streptomyces sp. 8N616 TaxID=3457414 RepID=UPI003FD46745
MGDATQRLTDIGSSDGPGLMAALTGGKSLAEGKSPLRSALSGGLAGVKEKAKEALPGVGKDGGESKDQKIKVVNIVEQIDVGIPVSAAYDQWTQFEEFPAFMKKVEHVEQESDTEVAWKAQIFLSHRKWQSTILEQVPDELIVWRSKADKGHVDGAVTFHELAPNLTRILLVLQYYPQGFFEQTGNLWRAQGRRARLELKHFRRHAMTHTLLHPDEVEGWRGEIHEGEVVDGGEEEGDEAREEESQEPEDEYEEEDEEQEAEDEGPEDAYDEEDEEEAEDEGGGEEDEDEDERDEDEDEPSAERPRRRSRAASR